MNIDEMKAEFLSFAIEAYKTKLGVHNSDMWYDISCHTGNDFVLAGKVEEWAKDAAIGSTYIAGPVSIKIVK